MRMFIKEILEGLREHAPKGAVPKPNYMESILQRLFPNKIYLANQFLKDETGQYVKVAGTKFKPDYILPELRIVIEIDGDSRSRRNHYSNANVAIKDRLKTRICTELGYKVVRIPSYIQLDSEMVRFYFGIDYAEELYPACHEHGFEHPDIALPADFCELGLERFEQEMRTYPQSVRQRIVTSLRKRITQYREEGYSEEDAISQVLPRRLLYLIQD